MKRIIKQIILVLILVLFPGPIQLLEAQCCKRKKPIRATAPETKIIQPVIDTDGDGIKPGSIKGEKE